MNKNEVQLVRDVFRQFNRKAGVLKTDPYGLGVTLTQGSALVDIQHFGSLRPNELVGLLNLEKSSISRMVNGLFASGLIVIRPDPADGRAKIITLTKKGERMATQINGLADLSVTDLLQKLSASERTHVIAAFKKVASVFANP
jgi:DNA-binding MarR family transcriptional regulator